MTTMLTYVAAYQKELNTSLFTMFVFVDKSTTFQTVTLLIATLFPNNMLGLLVVLLLRSTLIFSI